MSNRYFSLRLFKKRPKKGIRPVTKPKAFKSEADAKAWAIEHDLKGLAIEQIGDKKFKLRNS